MSDEHLDDDLDPAGDDGDLGPANPGSQTTGGGGDEDWAMDEDGAGPDGAGAGAGGPAMAFDFPSFDASGGAASGGDLAMLDDVSLKVSVELGRTRMFVEDILKLVPEAVIELDKAAGDPVDVFVNGRHVARGEVLVLNENFCVRINEIISASDEDD